MKNKFFSIFALLTLSLLGACGGSSGEPGGDRPGDRPGGGLFDGDEKDPTQGGGQSDNHNCDSVLFDVDELAGRGITLPGVVDGYLVRPVGGFISCTSRSSRSETNNSDSTSSERVVKRKGYSRIAVAQLPMKWELLEEQVDNDDLVQIVAEDFTPTSEQVSKLLLAMGIQNSTDGVNSVAVAQVREIGVALEMVAPGLEVTPLRTWTHQSDRNKALFYATTREAKLIRDLFDNGRSAEISFLGRFPGNGFPQKPAYFEMLLDNEAPQLLSIPPQNYLSRVWLGHAKEQNTKRTLMDQAKTSLRKELIQTSDFYNDEYKGLGEMRKLAEWLLKEPRRIERIHVSALRLLGELDALTPTTRFYLKWMEIFESELSVFSVNALRNAIQWQKDSKNLSAEQRKFTLRLAKIFKEARIQSFWTEAVSRASTLGYKESRLSQVRPVLNWVRSYEGLYLTQDTASLDRTIEIVNKASYTTESFELLKRTFDWVRSYSGAYVTDRMDAYQLANDLLAGVIRDNSDFAAFKNTYSWVKSYSGPYVTDNKKAVTESIAFHKMPKWGPSLFSVTKETFAWLQSYSGAYITDKATALRRTKAYIKRAGWNQTRLALLDKTFRWLQSYSGPYITDKAKALEKSESYLKQAEWSQEELELLNLTFKWVESYSGPYLTAKTEALAKAETFLKDQNWSRTRLSFTRATFEWLQSYSGPYITVKASALRKTEDYILERQMSRAQFNQLKQVFSKKKRELRNNEAALRAAEMEVFGNEV